MNHEAPATSWLSHLVELRTRLVRAVIAVIVLFAVFAFFSDRLYSLIAEPMIAALPAGSQMIATDPLTPFSTPLRLSASVSACSGATATLGMSPEPSQSCPLAGL